MGYMNKQPSRIHISGQGWGRPGSRKPGPGAKVGAGHGWVVLVLPMFAALTRATLIGGI